MERKKQEDDRNRERKAETENNVSARVAERLQSPHAALQNICTEYPARLLPTTKSYASGTFDKCRTIV
jgi:hypothetical protein